MCSFRNAAAPMAAITQWCSDLLAAIWVKNGTNLITKSLPAKMFVIGTSGTQGTRMKIAEFDRYTPADLVVKRIASFIRERELAADAKLQWGHEFA
jgi:hypothetical protein